MSDRDGTEETGNRPISERYVSHAYYRCCNAAADSSDQPSLQRVRGDTSATDRDCSRRSVLYTGVGSLPDTDKKSSYYGDVSEDKKEKTVKTENAGILQYSMTAGCPRCVCLSLFYHYMFFRRICTKGLFTVHLGIGTDFEYAGAAAD